MQSDAGLEVRVPSGLPSELEMLTALHKAAGTKYSANDRIPGVSFV